MKYVCVALIIVLFVTCESPVLKSYSKTELLAYGLKLHGFEPAETILYHNSFFDHIPRRQNYKDPPTMAGDYRIATVEQLFTEDINQYYSVKDVLQNEDEVQILIDYAFQKCKPISDNTKNCETYLEPITLTYDISEIRGI